jgi:hypothetical protein
VTATVDRYAGVKVSLVVIVGVSVTAAFAPGIVETTYAHQASNESINQLQINSSNS